MTKPPALVLPLQGSPQDHEYHLCDNPEEAVWRELLLIAEPFVLKKLWAGEGHDDLLEFVSTSIRQAYEYYNASKHLGEKTSPLFLYYSIHNLTKAALTLKNDSKAGLNHHGLSTSMPDADLFSYEVKQIDRGVFGSLAKASNLAWALKNEVKFSFLDFLRNTIEFVDPLGNIFEEDPSIIPFKIRRTSDGLVTLAIGIQDVNKREEIKVLANDKTDILTHYEQNDCDYFKKYDDLSELQTVGNETLQKLFKFAYAPCNEEVIYLDVSDQKFSQECCYYGLVYILGMIVRYHPDILGKILDERESRYRWLIPQVYNKAKRVYPNMMLNMMTGTSHKFITSV